MLRNRLKKIALGHPLLWRIATNTFETASRLRNKLQTRPPLSSVVIEVTNHCNLDCSMCANRHIARPKGFISRDVLDRALANTYEGAFRNILMFAVGEPLLHPELPDLLRAAAARTNRLSLSTNAVALNRRPELAERIMGSGVNHFHISADGFDAESYERVRKGARFEDLLACMAMFKNTRDLRNPSLPIEVQYCLVREHGLDDLAKALDVFEPYADLVVFKPMNNQGHTSIRNRPDQQILGKPFFRDAPVPCPLLWYGPTVLWDGRVSACCRDYDGSFVMGDLHHQSLPEIWHGAAFRTLRKDHQHRRFPAKCRDCTQLVEDYFRSIEINKLIRVKLGRPWKQLVH
jgi:MoaA/NifB/PqqE/SkfB family radical SAM enzyme